MLREQRRGRGSAPLGFLLHPENSLTGPEAAILALDIPKPSEAIEGSGCMFTPSCQALGAVGAQDDFSGPSATRELRKWGFQKPAYFGYSTGESEDGL